MRARALWFVEPHRVEIRPADLPERRDRLLVRTIASGISSGTELLAYRGAIDPSTPLDERLGAYAGTFAFPFRYGYACVGRVERPAGGLEPGAAVFAFHPHQDLVQVSPGDVVPVGDVPPRIATLLPLVETALQVSLDAEAEPDALAIVTGLGAVGLLTGLLLQRSRVDVVGVEPREDRRKLAADLGLPAVEPRDAPALVGERTGGEGADVVVEASGSGRALADSLGVLRHEGTVLVASWYGREPVLLPLGGAFHRRRLTIRSTQVSTIPARLSARWTRQRRLAAARDLLTELPLEPIAGRGFAFEDAPAAYEALDRGAPDLVHACLTYG